MNTNSFRKVENACGEFMLTLRKCTGLLTETVHTLEKGIGDDLSRKIGGQIGELCISLTDVNKELALVQQQLEEAYREEQKLNEEIDKIRI